MRRWLPFVLALLFVVALNVAQAASLFAPDVAHAAAPREVAQAAAPRQAEKLARGPREPVNEGNFRPAATAVAANRRPAPVVISAFSLSSSKVRVGGRPLRVKFQIAGGAPRVRVALYMTPAGGDRASLVKRFGVRRTGRFYRRALSISWGRVSPGRYVAALVAEDAVRGRRLRAAPAGFGSEVEVLAGLTGGSPVHSPSPTADRTQRPAPDRSQLPASPRETPAPVQKAPTPPRNPPAPAAPVPSTSTTAPVLNAAPTAGTEAGVFPVRGAWSFGAEGARFGASRGTRLHRGQDIVAADGTPLASPRAGVVNSKGYQEGGAGHYLVIRDLAGRDYVFMHMLAASPLAVGAAVAAGAHVGQVGNTGASSGPHLHFEIWPHGWFSSPTSQPIDPLPALQAWASS